MPRILLVDDKADQVRMSIEEILDEYELDLATDGPTAVEKAAAADCVLLDIKMPARLADVDEEEGIAALRRIRAAHPDLPVIMLTGYSDVDLVVEAMKHGAYHYVTKPPDINRLRQLICSALAEADLRRHARSLEETIAVRDELARPQEAADRQGLGALLGASPAMQQVYGVIERVAPLNVPVLLLGANGTGKELAAAEIHRLSGRTGRMVPLNCAAIPGELLESQLFGHRKGSFTDATDDRTGDFELAHGGTLFLDEIGDMPIQLQAKLLRVLQDMTIRPVGSQRYRKVDVRIVSSTNQDLAARIADGRFRRDLYYRLNVVRIELPPLAQRSDDIELLARDFLSRTCRDFGVAEKRLSAEAVALLRRYPWPGNVRELEHAVKQAVALCRRDVLTPDDFRLDEPTTAVTPGSTSAADAAWQELVSETSELDIVAARNRFGEEALAEVIRRAVRQTREVRAAGELLGFVPPGPEGDKAYAAFRKWLGRLGINRKDVLGR